MFSLQTLENGQVKEGGKIKDIRKRHVTWADFFQPSKDELAQLSEIVGMAPKEIEELLQPQNRPLITNIDKYSVIIMQSPATENDDSATMPVLMFISKRSNDFITVHSHDMPAIKRIRSWDEKRKVKSFAKGTTFILYTLIDELTSSYSAILSEIDDSIEKLENGIYEQNGGRQHLMKHAFEVKKKLIYFYKALVANRDVVSGIEKEYGTFLEKKDLSKFRLLYSDFTQLVELTVTYRDILTTTIEVYLSVVSNSLNVTMKKLTGWGAIIIIPTIISGIYGMNFQHMPEIQWQYGYELAVGLMLVSVTAAYIYFKKKEWI